LNQDHPRYAAGTYGRQEPVCGTGEEVRPEDRFPAPFIKIEAVPGQEFRQERINVLDHSAIVLTSRNAVDHFFRMCKELRTTVPESMKYFCVSESVAYYVQKYIVYRKRKGLHRKQSFGDLMDVIKEAQEEKYLVPGSDIQKQEIPQLAGQGGCALHQIASSTARWPATSSDMKSIAHDMLVFFSPAASRACARFPEVSSRTVR